ncbi:hypothetical protein BKA70DRAFT_1262293 [Coprinopsis sp. MPI-PUGE-AT-0042]|nr:hypothetical protein BKA70DRAFT_1262293 [Coprinopsis sp. MPI-PUGE-AT-0042]
MRFQITSVIAFLALGGLSVHAQTCGHCSDGKTQMCCYNLSSEGGVGYYCGTPNAPFPCQDGGVPPLKSICCDSYALTPRGYTGSGCALVTV